ncbi:MAG: YggS family pyridoxal phosphate-dependent enzyme [Gemmatimonadota bacterium]
MQEEVTTSFEERLASVRRRIEEAARRAGREPEAVELLPVTKGHPPALLGRVAEAGLGRIGENRVQEAEEKRDILGTDLGLHWHLIGHLQRNKAARAVRLFEVVESVDSVRLARRLSREVERAGRPGLPILIEVNTSGEETKAGFRAPALEAALTEICRLPGLRVDGLMTMAPWTRDEALLRSTFRRTRELLERCAARVEAFEGRVLSMGMSNDFEIAVEEGSTRVRLGTVLFGERAER